MVEVINNIIKWGLEFYGRYYSTYKGYVIDNNDPLKQGRLLVSAPTVWNRNDYSKWAYPDSVYSGKGYGIQLLPEIGEQIHLTFEHGNRKYPTWKHANYTENEKPTEFDLPGTKGIITPNGTKIIIIKEDGEENLVIECKGTITINGGKFGGLVKIQELKDSLESIKSYVESLKDATNTGISSAGPTGPAASATFTSTMASLSMEIKEMENNKILQ